MRQCVGGSERHDGWNGRNGGRAIVQRMGAAIVQMMVQNHSKLGTREQPWTRFCILRTTGILRI